MHNPKFYLDFTNEKYHDKVQPNYVKGKIVSTFKIEADTKDLLQQMKDHTGLSMGKIIDLMVAEIGIK